MGFNRDKKQYILCSNLRGHNHLKILGNETKAQSCYLFAKYSYDNFVYKKGMNDID